MPFVRRNSASLTARNSRSLSYTADPNIDCVNVCCAPCAPCLLLSLENWPPKFRDGSDNTSPGPIDGDWLIPLVAGGVACWYSLRCLVDIDFEGIHYSYINVYIHLRCLSGNLIVTGSISLLDETCGATGGPGPLNTYSILQVHIPDTVACPLPSTFSDGATVYTLDTTDDEECADAACISDPCPDCCPDVVCGVAEIYTLSGTLIWTSAVVRSGCRFWVFCQWPPESDPSQSYSYTAVGFIIECDEEGNPTVCHGEFIVGYSHGAPVFWVDERRYGFTGPISCTEQTTFPLYYSGPYYPDGIHVFDIKITLKEDCTDDYSCGVPPTIPFPVCEEDCIECDDCPPYCLDEGTTTLHAHYQMFGGECGDCTIRFFGGGCGYCFDACPEGAGGYSLDCPAFNLDKADCLAANHQWYCDPECMADCALPEAECAEIAQSSPCTGIITSGNVDLPLVSHTATTMTFADSIPIGPLGNMEMQCVFDCVAKSYAWTITLLSGRCEMSDTFVDDCYHIQVPIGIVMYDNTLGNTCNDLDSTPNGIQLSSVRIDRVGCPV